MAEEIYEEIPEEVVELVCLRYDANGGSGAPSETWFEPPAYHTIPSTIPTRFGHTFLGWSTSPSATSASYVSGDRIYLSDGATLYAVWQSPTVIPSDVINSSYDAFIAYDVGYKFYSFTPSATCKYRFESHQDDIDSCIYLYDSSGTQLAFNNDGGNILNFLLDYNFTSGTKYYIKVEFLGFVEEIEEIEPVEAIEVIDEVVEESYEGITINFTVKCISQAIVTYDANGGSGAPSSQTITPGATLTIPSTIPTRFPYTFLGWSTSSSATSATYEPGYSFTTNANITLYAVWQAATTISSNVTDSSYSASIPFGGVVKYYVFTPSTDGKCRFESSGDLDTRIYLYNASGSTLDTDDDDGDGSNFLLDYNFTSGTTYYIMVKFYYSSTTGIINFTVKRQLGLVYICDNTGEFNPYQIFIYDGSSWNQYVPYIYNGSSWDLYS